MDIAELNDLPNLIYKKFNALDVGEIQSDLCSRQVIALPLDETAFRYELLSEYERGIFDAITIDENYIDFSKLPDDTYLPCRYNCSSGFFTVPEDYMKYVKCAKPATIKVIVYGAEHATPQINKSIEKYITKDIQLPKIENLVVNKELEYVSFEETKYNIIEIDGYNYYVLNINLPYSYYSRIPLVDSTFSYDINTKTLYEDDTVIGTDIVESFIENYNKLNDSTDLLQIYILANNNAILPSCSHGSSSDIFFAKFFKVPFITASMVVSDWKIPFATEEGRKCPITAAGTNEICKPYFIFSEQTDE